MDGILDECLHELLCGIATLEQCLARYPEQADALRPLLQTALRVRQGARAQMRPEARLAAKERMLAPLADKRQRENRSTSLLSGSGDRLLSPGGRPNPRLLQRSGALLVRACLALAVVLLSALPGGFYQQARAQVIQRTGLLTDLVGTVEYQEGVEGVWRVAASGLALKGGWHFRTGKIAAATLRFFDGSVTCLGANTDVVVRQLSSRRDGGGSAITLYQERGETRNDVRALRDDGSRFEVITPSAVASVHGTVFSVGVAQDGTTTVSVTEGAVGLARDGELEWLFAGQLASVGPPPEAAELGVEDVGAPATLLEGTGEPLDRSESVGVPGPTGGMPDEEEDELPERPTHPSHPANADVFRGPQRPEHPQHPTHPEQPEHPEHPDKPDKPDKPDRANRGNQNN